MTDERVTKLNMEVTAAIPRAEGLLRDAESAWRQVARLEAALAEASTGIERDIAQHGVATAERKMHVLGALMGLPPRAGATESPVNVGLQEEHDEPCPHCAGTGKMRIPAEVATVECYFFGCWDAVGHHYYDHWGRRNDKTMPAGLRPEQLDCGYAPGAIQKKSQFERSRPEVEGEAALHHIEGWTVLSYWDRSVDARPSSNSSFVAKGTHSFAIMRAIALAQYAQIWKRRATEPVLVQGE